MSGHGTGVSDSGKPAIKRVECGICDKSWGGLPVGTLAKKIARHWNHEHGDEFQYSSIKPFDSETIVEEHLHGDEYRCRVYKDYITAYDVIDPDSSECGPFAYEYVKNPEAENVCEDCWRSIKAVDGYRNISTDGWRDTYLCDDCAHERKVERRKNENQSLEEYNGQLVETDGGTDIDRRDPTTDPCACSVCGVYIGFGGDDYCDGCAREIGAKPPMNQCMGCGQVAPQEDMKAIDVSPEDEYYPDMRYLCRSCEGGGLDV